MILCRNEANKKNMLINKDSFDQAGYDHFKDMIFSRLIINFDKGHHSWYYVINKKLQLAI